VLGSPAYLRSKMSSTLVSSLITGTPVVADEAMLKAYSFLHRGDVFLMEPGEDEVDAMLRVRGGAWGLGRAGPRGAKGVGEGGRARPLPMGPLL
jgi:hypothetical protein